MNIKEIDSGHFKDCERKGATTIKVITLQEHRKEKDYIYNYLQQSLVDKSLVTEDVFASIWDSMGDNKE